MALPTAAAAVPATIEERDAQYAADPELRRFVESMGGEAYVTDIGRISYRKTWEETLADGLYLMAPRGKWNSAHPAWARAHQALADTLRRELVATFATHQQNNRRLINQECMYALTADERREAAQFFESPGGRAFIAARTLSAHRDAYGLPPGIESESLEQIKAATDKSFAALDALPEDHGAGKAIKVFLDSPVWKKVLRLQLYNLADIVRYDLNLDTQELLLKHTAALAGAVRKAAPGVPPPSDKTYLGSVEMAPDRGFTVTVEHFIGLNRVGRYTLKYGTAELHWNDIAAMVPGILPGESRFIFFDTQGRVGDQP